MALEDLAVTIVGDAALVFATLVLARNTRALYKATNVLGQIERKRDLRLVLSERIEISEGLSAMEGPILVTEYLGGVGRRTIPQVAEAAAWIRRLRTLIPKIEDKSTSNLVFSLDYVIMNLDNADGGAIGNESVVNEVSKHVESIKGQLRNIFLPRWRKELEALYGE